MAASELEVIGTEGSGHAVAVGSAIDGIRARDGLPGSMPVNAMVIIAGGLVGLPDD